MSHIKPVMERIYMSHVTRMNESCLTIWVMFHVRENPTGGINLESYAIFMGLWVRKSELPKPMKKEEAP